RGRGSVRPDRAEGASVFSAISGFTPLAEAMIRRFGPQRGAEELMRYLDLVYDTVIAEADTFRGSVVSFAGDAITCWFDGDDGRRAVATAFAMQRAMARVSAVPIDAGATVALARSVAVVACLA